MEEALQLMLAPSRSGNKDGRLLDGGCIRTEDFGMPKMSTQTQAVRLCCAGTSAEDTKATDHGQDLPARFPVQ